MKNTIKKKMRILSLSFLGIVLVFLAYQFLLRPILKKSMATEVAAMGILFILSAALIITLLIIFTLVLYLCILKAQKVSNTEIWKSYTKKTFLVFLLIIILLSGFTYYSQKNAYTKPLCNEYNDMIPISISKIEKVKIGDNDEWISIRGENRNNPILLVLSDGPGKSEMASFNNSLKDLEKNFVIVNWDEIGAGKSYKRVKELTMDNYVSDGVELTKYLCQKFNKSKIYVLGNSFGSVLGMLMVKNSPNLYEGFIGTSQIVSVKRNEEYRYNKAMDIASTEGDEREIRKLKAQGEPPYDKESYKKQKVYSNYIRNKEKENNKISGDGENIFKNIFSSEYGIIDKINVVLGEKRTYDKVYKNYYDIDLFNSVKDVAVPVYFFEGKYDDLSCEDLLDKYYNSLNAEKKEIVWFEASGSKPWISENDKFVKTVNEKFLNR